VAERWFTIRVDAGDSKAAAGSAATAQSDFDVED
jgi:hypothetical protein